MDEEKVQPPGLTINFQVYISKFPVGRPYSAHVADGPLAETRPSPIVTPTGRPIVDPRGSKVECRAPFLFVDLGDFAAAIAFCRHERLSVAVAKLPKAMVDAGKEAVNEYVKQRALELVGALHEELIALEETARRKGGEDAEEGE